MKSLILALFIALSAHAQVPEILSARKREPLPNVYESYPLEEIATSLIQWIHETRESKANEAGPDFDFMKDTRIVMAVDYKVLKLIKKNGFLNQHDTKSSKGTYSLGGRAWAEDQMLDLNLEPKYGEYGPLVNKIRPKYSFVLFNKPRPDMGTTLVTEQYGNVFVVFKDRVKLRSTFSPQDSLGLPAKMIRTFHYRSKKLLKREHTVSYWEAQTWGPLTMDDVDYLLVDCLEKLWPWQYSGIKKLGVPVHECEAKMSETIKGYAYDLVKGKRLN